MIHTPAHREYRRNIYDLSLEFMNPTSSERAMRKSLESKTNVQEKILLKDRMMSLKNIGTNEVQSLAAKVTKKIKYNKENVTERIVKFIMNIKVEDILKDIEDAKTKSTRDQKSLDEIVRPSLIQL